MRPEPLDSPEGPPRIVLLAVATLALLFLAGGVYLFISNPFTGTEIIAPARLPAVMAVVTEYRGPIFGLEGARRLVERELAQKGLAGGWPITIYAESPWLMRPIQVQCRVGYLLLLGREVEGLPAPLRLEKIDPGNRLIVRVAGRGNFTGNKAYTAALRFLQPMGLRPAEAERYEVKIRIRDRDFVEHWIPVR